ncbi:helix-turn-helix transcriptional regulator [Hymenobacter aerilatus]|uniref:Helix-turn-helix transcriptional regulator n=1 Tax=Hymenobacter aerilatus TaxID=2932251 RepID=A0A8T9SXN7_9BACT|nr:helix-turn-helix transcriptional regulator [Hymenobacter aerilatus]UOR06487.1 helix-turn-helix transcriptional regulator [Hymenobacter aerilatus]
MPENTINQRLKILIEALDLKTGSFSRALGVSETNVRNYIERGSKPSSDFLEKLIRHFEHINSTWLLTGQGEMFLNEQRTTQIKHTAKNSGQAVITNHGNATMHYTKVADCEKDLLVAQKEIELLRSHLQDKERIIQLLEMQLKK